MENTNLKIKIRKILLENDPMGIYFPEDNNTDEYDKEIKMIIAGLNICKNENELLNLIWDIFKKQFSESSASTKGRFKSLSNKIWQIVNEENVN